MNLIEHLWWKIKYLWMPLEAYASFKALQQAVEEILVGVGTEYRITFSETVGIGWGWSVGK
ncbi:MAG: hypothetical protein ACR2GR_12235 [Rhodothermales bacterium]